MDKYEFTVPEQFNNKNITTFLEKEWGFSKTLIRHVKFGGMFINGKSATTKSVVSADDVVTIVLPKEQKNPYSKPQKKPLKIIYEDDYILAVFKPKNVATHNSRNENIESLQNWVEGYFEPKTTVYRAINRLDRDTVGIVLVAKDWLIASLLSEQIANGGVEKTYEALICKAPEKDHFFIDAPIDKKSPTEMKRVVSPLGKHALTECFLTKKLSCGKALLKIILHTGRTHQIRVHLAHIGAPLYADNLYGKEEKGQSYYLCANQIKFTHPITKERICLKV